MDAKLPELPQDRESLAAILRSLILERDQQKQRADELHLENLRQRKRADELYVENLQLQKELVQLKKLYCGPRADRLESEQELAQALLNFALDLERKPDPSRRSTAED